MKLNKYVKKGSAAVLSGLLVMGIGMPSQDVFASIVSGEKFLGNVIAGSVPSNYSTYWNQVTPENATKWGSVEGNRDMMNWGNSDLCYNYAKQNNYPFKFHTLVWGSQEPGWVKNLSQKEQKEEVLEWIQAASAKYRDADFVDVVNEPLHAKPSYKNAIGGDGQTGWDWVIWSFEQARKNFDGKLFINEYGIISDPNATNNYLKIINLLKERGLIDGIGIQCHQFNVDNASTSVMKANLDKLAATGLPIYVSELDITGDDNTQLARYKEKFPVLWEHPAVKGVTLWGYTQGQTWIDNTYLVTNSGAERPALKWLKEYLGNNTGSTGNTGNTGETGGNTGNTDVDKSVAVTGDFNVWDNGYTVNMTIKNNEASAVNGWKLVLNKSDFTITSSWSANVEEVGDKIIITPYPWNSTINGKGSVSFGFQGTGKPNQNFTYEVE